MLAFKSASRCSNHTPRSFSGLLLLFPGNWRFSFSTLSLAADRQICMRHCIHISIGEPAGKCQSLSKYKRLGIGIGIAMAIAIWSCQMGLSLSCTQSVLRLLRFVFAHSIGDNHKAFRGERRFYLWPRKPKKRKSNSSTIISCWFSAAASSGRNRLPKLWCHLSPPRVHFSSFWIFGFLLFWISDWLQAAGGDSNSCHCLRPGTLGSLIFRVCEKWNSQLPMSLSVNLAQIS